MIANNNKKKIDMLHSIVPLTVLRFRATKKIIQQQIKTNIH